MDSSHCPASGILSSGWVHCISLSLSLSLFLSLSLSLPPSRQTSSSPLSNPRGPPNLSSSQACRLSPPPHPESTAFAFAIPSTWNALSSRSDFDGEGGGRCWRERIWNDAPPPPHSPFLHLPHCKPDLPPPSVGDEAALGGVGEGGGLSEGPSMGFFTCSEEADRNESSRKTPAALLPRPQLGEASLPSHCAIFSPSPSSCRQVPHSQGTCVGGRPERLEFKSHSCCLPSEWP